MGILTVNIRKREGTVYQGSFRSVSSTNAKGPFDILPYHINFVSVVQDYLHIVSENGKQTKLEIDRGILRVKENNVEIYLGI